MKKRTAWMLGGIAAISLAVVAFIFDDEGGEVVTLEAASPYAPDCQADDPLCVAWAEFRHARPYPHQTFAAKILPDGTLGLVLSEPAPVLAKVQLRELVQATFGSDLLSIEQWRWNIGVDGWVEDLAIRVKGPATTAVPSRQADPLDDPVMRDRIALLHAALYGTTFGGRLEIIGKPLASAGKSAAPNLRGSAKELRDWLADPALAWYRIDARDDGPVAWSRLVTSKTSGAYASDDGTLVMLTFPVERVLAAAAGRDSLTSLRADFRRFAVSTDSIVGGVWTPDGQAAVIGRARVSSLDAMPPLRFETFTLLAAQSSDELHQSYERTNLFAGKLNEGEYEGKDWAPIYLSDALIDSELGALLNITDQMLKSWSQAGSIEYIYFTYPLKPPSFAFGKKPLSRIVYDETGSRRVLFNWNTSGLAVAVNMSDMTVLAVKQTGALPITYGGELRPGGETETGHLFKYEEQAYDYFAGVKDPNLARVVQYTALYQLFRAISTDPAVARTAGISPQPSDQRSARARFTPARYLAAQAAVLLNAIDDGALQDLRPDVPAHIAERIAALNQEVATGLREYREKHPEVSALKLAALLADPRSEGERLQAETDRVRPLRQRLIGEQDRIERLYEAFKKEVEDTETAIGNWLTENKVRVGPNDGIEDILPRLPARLRDRFKALQTQQDALERREEALKVAAGPLHALTERSDALDSADSLRRILNPVVPLLLDLEEIRQDFVAQHAHEPNGWIKTPSIVLSWSMESTRAVGGHNLNARTLRFEPSTAVADVGLAETEQGLVLRYNPARSDTVAAKATDLARAVEHRKIGDVEELRKVLDAPAPARTRTAALELPQRNPSQPSADRWGGRLGNRLYQEKKPFIDDLRAMAESNECCIFVARDESQAAYIADRNLRPPPAIVVRQASDTPSLAFFLKETARGKPKPIVFLDHPPEHVRALTLGMAVEDGGSNALLGFAQRLGTRSSAEESGKSALHVVDFDLLGRRTSLSALDAAGQLRGQSLYQRVAAVFQRKTPWQNARVSQLDGRSAEEFARRAGWDAARDGTPSAVVLSFGPSGPGGKALDIGVLAGFERANLPAGKARLLTAHDQALRAAVRDEGTIGQYCMTLKAQLQELAGDQLKRLSIVIRDGDTETLLSQRESADALSLL